MNLVMQFRKVCNHPDLFERADVISPFLFGSFSHSGNLNRQGDQLYCPDSASNAITVELPRIVWEEGVARPREEGTAGSDTHVLRNLMSIWKEGWVNDQLKAGADVGGGGGYGFVKLMGSTPGEVVRKARNHPLVSLLEDAAGQQSLVEDGPYKSSVSLSHSLSKC
jgi:DNA helicase INO80